MRTPNSCGACGVRAALRVPGEREKTLALSGQNTCGWRTTEHMVITYDRPCRNPKSRGHQCRVTESHFTQCGVEKTSVPPPPISRWWKEARSLAMLLRGAAATKTQPALVNCTNGICGPPVLIARLFLVSHASRHASQLMEEAREARWRNEGSEAKKPGKRNKEASPASVSLASLASSASVSLTSLAPPASLASPTSFTSLPLLPPLDEERGEKRGK